VSPNVSRSLRRKDPLGPARIPRTLDSGAGGREPLVLVRDLTVELPGGHPLVENTELVVAPGTVVSILGPSGAGKTTLLRAIFSPDELRDEGYAIEVGERSVGSESALVPQRGALLDHLDVAHNIALVQPTTRTEPATWLEAVGLGSEVAAPGRSVSALSGGQAQRVAVARAFAAGRRIVVLDEPSVGIDPLGVRLLAKLLVEQARQNDAAILVITHDLTLAAAASDQILFLDPVQRSLTPIRNCGGQAELEAAVDARLRSAETTIAPAQRRSSSRFDPLAPLRAAGEAIRLAFAPRLFLASTLVFLRGLVETFVRPVLFYATVGALLGFTVPYVIANISSDLRPAAVFELIKGTYVLSLAPPLSAIVFAATSGSAINAWLGGLRLHGQVTALSGLGVSPSRYLFTPSWWALVVGYLATVASFTLAMIGGGWVLYAMNGVARASALLTADFVDPAPSRGPFLVRGAWLVLMYAIGIASIVVSSGRAPKQRSEDVTKAMTSAVMRATLMVVVLELASIMLLRAWTQR